MCIFCMIDNVKNVSDEHYLFRKYHRRRPPWTDSKVSSRNISRHRVALRLEAVRLRSYIKASFGYITDWKHSLPPASMP